MTPGQVEVLAVALLAGWSCCLPGTWLVLRGSAMLVDAISHTVLLGIVLGFLLSGDLGSPLLRAGAALIGILTVIMVDLLARRPLVRTDASIGLVFPVLFALAVLLITLLADNVHLDTDVVLTGEIGLTPFDRIEFGQYSIPRSFVYLGAVLLLNAGLTAAFWKELKVASFDPGLAAAIGMAPGAVGLGLVAATSLTAVTAFEAVGSILVVALVVGPPASAQLLTRRLQRMVFWSLALSASAGVLGYAGAWYFDTTIAGSIACVIGIQFTGAVLASPRRGLIARLRIRRRRRLEFAQTLLVKHLLNHYGTPQEAHESELEHLHAGLGWEPDFAQHVAGAAAGSGLVRIDGDRLRLLGPGRIRAETG